MCSIPVEDRLYNLEEIEARKINKKMLEFAHDVDGCTFMPDVNRDRSPDDSSDRKTEKARREAVFKRLVGEGQKFVCLVLI